MNECRQERYEGCLIHTSEKGYKTISQNRKTKMIHVLVWEKVNGPKPKGHDIHHIDHDKSNYALDNLQLLSFSDHRRVHQNWTMTDGKWTHKICNKCEKTLHLDNFYKTKGRSPATTCKPCTRKHRTRVNSRRQLLNKARNLYYASLSEDERQCKIYGDLSKEERCQWIGEAERALS